MSGNTDFQLLALNVAGALTTSSVTDTFVVPFPAQLVEVWGYVETAPTGADLHVAIKQNGTAISTGPLVVPATAHAATTLVVTPGVAAGANVPGGTVPSPTPVATFAAGDTVQLSVTQIGSTVAGSDLAVTLVLSRV